MAFFRIAVAIDGSSHSLAALKAAIDLAPDLASTEFHLIHSVEVPRVADGGYSSGASSHHSAYVDLERTESFLEDFGTNVLNLAADMLKERGVDEKNVHVKLLGGHSHPRDAFVKFCKKMRVDLIVAGTRGRSKLKRMLHGGSFCSYLVNFAHSSVYVVKAHGVEDQATGESSTEHRAAVPRRDRRASAATNSDTCSGQSDTDGFTPQQTRTPFGST